MITTRRTRAAKKRRAEESDGEAPDPTDALVRTTASLRDANDAARKAAKQHRATEKAAAAFKAERDALAAEERLNADGALVLELGWDFTRLLNHDLTRQSALQYCKPPARCAYISFIHRHRRPEKRSTRPSTQ